MSIDSAHVGAASPPRGPEPGPPSRESQADSAPGARGLTRFRRFSVQRRLAAGLGMFSIGLGLLELLAPRSVARLIGIEEPWTRRASRLAARGVSRWSPARRRWRRALGDWSPRRSRGIAGRALGRAAGTSGEASLLVIRALGARELASGLGVLTRPRPAAWLWSRVAGDMVDLSLLGLAMSSPRNNRARLAGTTAAVLGITALDVLSSIEFTRVHRRTRRSWAVIGRGVPIEVTTIVNRSPQDCYRLWRDLEHIPRFMRRVESVEVESERRSHWVARTPGGLRIEWDSEITHDAPGRIISWRSTSADVPNAGSVHFDPAPGGRGTLVRVRLMHEVPGGALGKVAIKLFGKVPAIQIREDLRRFKQLLETGEIATTRGQSSGRRSVVGRALAGDSDNEG